MLNYQRVVMNVDNNMGQSFRYDKYEIDVGLVNYIQMIVPIHIPLYEYNVDIIPIGYPNSI
jgi:hypothetical protein